MSTLATYDEKRFDGYRSFELLEDRIVVKGKASLGAEFEATVMLNTLQSHPSIVRSRNTGFLQGVGMTLITVILLQSGVISPLSYWGGLLIVFAIAGILLTLATLRKIEWAYFNSKAGVLALTIARVGKQTASYESFVKTLTVQISLANESLIKEPI